MKVLVIGGGAREHALIWSLLRSPRVAEVVCAPGNGGIAAIARCIPVNVASIAALTALAQAESPQLVLIGPEIPLAAGLVDTLDALGIPAIGPTLAAVQLEASKAFAKRFMRRWHIPTAHYAVCEAAHGKYDQAADLVRNALEKFPQRVVVKADGLAAGKGVILCETHAEAVSAAEDLFSGRTLGTHVSSLVLEEMLEGPELSYFALCDGESATTLGFAQDHKRIGEGDTGPNTGGMGAYSMESLASPELAEWCLHNVAKRVVEGMRAEGTPFRGILFTGLMLTPEGPRVLEFNTRFGDPETQVLMLRLDTPLIDLLEAVVERRVASLEVRRNTLAAACVVAASTGYPGSYQTGKPISGAGLEAPGVLVFHSGTALDAGNTLITAGGRVLTVAAAAADLQTALSHIYNALEDIHFEGRYYRRDIGWRARKSALGPSPLTA